MSKSYVQYGCGLCAPDGWSNFDASPRLRFERLPGVGAVAGAMKSRLFPENVAFGDIVAGLPVPDGSVDGVYASHILEHIGRNDIGAALANTLRMLRPGGIFRMIVPDIGWRAERYIKERADGQHDAADRFIAACNFSAAKRPRGPMAILRSWFGFSSHYWMYDRDLMTDLLKQAGFIDIRPCEFGDSGDPMFAQVEDRGRFFDDGHPEAALQARRPDALATKAA